MQGNTNRFDVFQNVKTAQELMREQEMKDIQIDWNRRLDEAARTSNLRPDSIDNNKIQDDTNRFNKFQKIQPVEEIKTIKVWRNTPMMKSYNKQISEIDFIANKTPTMNNHDIQHTHSPRYPNITVVSISILFCFAFLMFIFCIGLCVEKCWSKCHKKKLKTVEKLDNVYSNTSPLIELFNNKNNNNKC